MLYRAIDAYSDVFQGYFQQQNRSDLAGKVQFYRSWISILVFGLSLILAKSLMISKYYYLFDKSISYSCPRL